jgi:hypothetical protein
MEFKVTNNITTASVKQHHASPPTKLAGKMVDTFFIYIYIYIYCSSTTNYIELKDVYSSKSCTTTTCFFRYAPHAAKKGRQSAIFTVY